MRCWPARSPSGSPYCCMPRGTASRWLVYGSRSDLGDPERSDTSQRSCVHSAAHPPPAGPDIRAGSRETVGKSQKQSQREQARADKRRTILIVVLAIVVGLGIIAYPAIRLIQDAKLKNTATADIGAKASAAACDAVLTDPAETYEQHETQEGIVIKYKYSPPTSGKHYQYPATFDKKYYTSDRPPISTLVHNLEHGYTIVWYDDTIGKDKKQLRLLERIAKGKLPASSQGKIIIAPFHANDGDAWPAGKHIAFSHWGAPTDRSTEEKAKTTQVGHRQFCGSVSGEAIQAFTDKYPADDTPEPGAA